MPYFTWNAIFKKYPNLKDKELIAVCGPRNIGKTTDTYIYIKEIGGFKENAKVAILRNTEKELITARQDFNNRFLNKYKCIGNSIYTMKKTYVTTEEGKVPIYQKDKHVGYMCAISTYTNLKSIEAKHVKFIIYEEFNEDTAIGRNIYPQFINIITTLIRFSKCKILMLGNKDGFMSDFYVNWNIIPQTKNDNDVIYPIGDFGVWIELGNKDYEDLGNNQQLFFKLAMLDNRTKTYLQGGYIHGLNPIVKNYEELKQKAKTLYYLAIDEQKYSFCKYDNNYCIISPWNIDYQFNDNLKTYNLDLMSRLLKESSILDEDDSIEIITNILMLIKKQCVYFDSYDTLQSFKDVTLILKKL